MKRKFAALALTLATMIAAAPMSVFAESQTVDVSETDSFAVSASASVTDQELADLGLNLIVSFPTEIALSLNEDKEFVGSDQIYACLSKISVCSGICPAQMIGKFYSLRRRIGWSKSSYSSVSTQAQYPGCGW
ncbi:MAG: hypothetical protein MR508_01720 [Lachnospiraceae bacterium]|nr:hypothetical protein [Lachnospiraceae bacterium]